MRMLYFRVNFVYLNLKETKVNKGKNSMDITVTCITDAQ